MCREGFGGIGEFSGVFVFGEARGIEHFGELGRFLGSRGVVGGNGVEVEGVEKGPFFVRRHEGVLHQLVEGFKALDIYSNGVFVALFGPVEGVLLCKADASQVAHRSLKLKIRSIFSIPLFASLYPIQPPNGLNLSYSIAQAPTCVL